MSTTSSYASELRDHLAHLADDSGEVQTSLDSLSRELRRSKTSMVKASQELRAHGLLTVKQNGPRRSASYKLIGR